MKKTYVVVFTFIYCFGWNLMPSSSYGIESSQLPKTPATKDAIISQMAQPNSMGPNYRGYSRPGFVNNNDNYAKTAAATRLGEEGLQRYTGTSQQEFNLPPDTPKKIVVKPRPRSIEQQVWEDFSYPDSRFAR